MRSYFNAKITALYSGENGNWLPFLFKKKIKPIVDHFFWAPRMKWIILFLLIKSSYNRTPTRTIANNFSSNVMFWWFSCCYLHSSSVKRVLGPCGGTRPKTLLHPVIIYTLTVEFHFSAFHWAALTVPAEQFEGRRWHSNRSPSEHWTINWAVADSGVWRRGDPTSTFIRKYSTKLTNYLFTFKDTFNQINSDLNPPGAL